jgi:Ca2+-binding EF-hand superfamily protein
MLIGIIHEFDIDGNNRISFSEFVDFMGTIILQKHTPSLFKNSSVPIEEMLKRSFKSGGKSMDSLVLNMKAVSAFD